MKIAIIGSRGWTDWNRFEDELAARVTPEWGTVVSGGAIGVDAAARVWAKKRGLDVREFLADWNRYGKSAGMRRNADIIGYADEVIAFWDGASKGTHNSIERAKAAGKACVVITAL